MDSPQYHVKGDSWADIHTVLQRLLLTFGQVTYQGPQIVCLLLFSLTHQHYICQVIPHHTKKTGAAVHLG